MRISDWSSDVCSSDLSACLLNRRLRLFSAQAVLSSAVLSRRVCCVGPDYFVGANLVNRKPRVAVGKQNGKLNMMHTVAAPGSSEASTTLPWPPLPPRATSNVSPGSSNSICLFTSLESLPPNHVAGAVGKSSAPFPLVRVELFSVSVSSYPSSASSIQSKP